MRHNKFTFAYKEHDGFKIFLSFYNVIYFALVVACNIVLTLKNALKAIAAEWHDSYTHEWRSLNRKVHRPGYVSETARAEALVVQLQAMLRANLWARYMAQRLFARLVKYLKTNFNLKTMYKNAYSMAVSDYEAYFLDITINPVRNLAIKRFCHVLLSVFFIQLFVDFIYDICPIARISELTFANAVYFAIYASKTTFTFLLSSIQFYAKMPSLATSAAGILALLLVITAVSNLIIYVSFRFSHVMNKFFLKMKGMRYTKFK